MMSALRFSFEHPVKGRLWFRHLSGQKNASICRGFDTGSGTDLAITLKGLEAGSWELSLEWEHEERSYHHQQTFVVKSLNHRLFKLSKYAEASLYRGPHAVHV